MKQLINRRSLSFFLVAGAALIALTSFIYGYTNDRVYLLPPWLIMLLAGLVAFGFEKIMQKRTK
ncbi:MAG: hypothetical protein ACK519_00280 [Sphingomonadaceae bacterium]|jgi:fatty acid desaturase